MSLGQLAGLELPHVAVVVYSNPLVSGENCALLCLLFPQVEGFQAPLYIINIKIFQTHLNI